MSEILDGKGRKMFWFYKTKFGFKKTAFLFFAPLGGLCDTEEVTRSTQSIRRGAQSIAKEAWSPLVHNFII